MAADRIAAMDFAAKLLKLCWQRGWSQRDLSEHLDGVSKSTVSNWMTGKADPRRRELVRLARLFDVTVTYLALDEFEEPAGDGLSEVQHRVLWAAETVGYELALKRIMNVPGAAGEGVTAPTAAERTHDAKKGRGRQR